MSGNMLEDMLMKEMDCVLSCCTDGNEGSLVSVQTIKYRTLNQLMVDLDLTFSHVARLLDTHIPVHPEIIDELRQFANKQGEFNYILAQDFIKHDKLMKVLRAMSKNGYSNKLNAILAMDGLGGAKWSVSPNFETKKYLENLKYSLSGKVGLYDRDMEDSAKRLHVFAVRKVYEELYHHDFKDNGELMAGVYRVMCQVFKDMAGLKLPSAHEVPIPMDLMKTCVDLYKSYMKPEDFMNFIAIYKHKNDIAITEEGDEPPKKMKKTKLETTEPKKRKRSTKKSSKLEEPNSSLV